MLEHDTGLGPDVPDRQRLGQFPASGLAPPPVVQPASDGHQLRLGQSPLERCDITHIYSTFAGCRVGILGGRRHDVGSSFATVTDYFWREDNPWLVLQLPDGQRTAAPAAWTDLPAETFPLTRARPLLLADALPPMARLCQRLRSARIDPTPSADVTLAAIWALCRPATASGSACDCPGWCSEPFMPPTSTPRRMRDADRSQDPPRPPPPTGGRLCPPVDPAPGPRTTARAPFGNTPWPTAPRRWVGPPRPYRRSTRIRDGPGPAADHRDGFKRLLAEIGAGQVGVVLALEASRLARSSVDWHRLVEICVVTRTLLADESAVYDPRDPNDRLLLGVKGTISEAELFTIRCRLHDGPLEQGPPRQSWPSPCRSATSRTEAGVVLKHPDRQVQARLGYIFDLFAELRVARRVVARLRREKLQIPAQAWGGPGHGEVRLEGARHSAPS